MDYTLTLTQPEVQMIGAALGALPFAQVAGLMAKLQQQVVAQEAKAAAPLEAVAETP